MGRNPSTAIAFASILSIAALGSTLSAQYEEKGKPSPQPSPAMTSPSATSGGTGVPATRPMQPTTATGANAMSLTAKLVDPEAKAKKQAATVTVAIRGVRIVDPSISGEKPNKGEGHLHYQVDDGPIVATTVPKLSFHGLKPGTHSIMVQLAANDHTPLGPEQKLSVTIP